MTLWVVGALITYILAIDFATKAYDSALLDSARAVASRLVFKGGTTIVDLPPAAQSILKWNEKDDFFYQVLTSKGKLISGDDSVPEPVWDDLSKEPTYRDARIGNHDVRIVELQVPVPDRPNNEFVVIQVAETSQGREELTDNVLLGVVLPQLVLIILAALAVWFGVARGLRPLRELQNAVASRSPSDLSPLNALSAPKEVKPLVLALNELLGRLAEDREAQKRFVANAAHQLRTPLAGLKTQAELAERYRNADDLRQTLRYIRTSADRATRLVNQLLSLARVEPAASKTITKEPVDLIAVVRDATAEIVPQALQKNIDLGFEAPEESCWLLGDAASLFDLAANLIENAVLYTQEGGRVTVRVECQSLPRLIIEDNGPGIPEAERERVFERFYRSLGTGVSGSGLGLSIVREIAEMHGAAIRLDTGIDGVGTSIAVEFSEGKQSTGGHAEPVSAARTESLTTRAPAPPSLRM
jgi:two-component system sensor histidine kinase TctE